MTVPVQRYAYQAWVTRQMREDSALPVDDYLAAALAEHAGREGWRVLMDSVTVEWRSHDSDPMALVGMPDDDPRREMWVRGDLFHAVCTASVIPA
jgi:hypothetical protein